MTTDLTGDFELDEEEFDWDVFVPDPDEADIAAETAALDDEAELDLDDSDLDWEAALREEPPPEGAPEGEARAGAAFERIVDTVRRSFEEPESESAAGLGSAPEREPHSAVAPEPQDQAELELEAGFEPEVELEHETETAIEPHAEGDAHDDREQEQDPARATEPDSRSTLEPEPRRETEVLLVAEPTPESGAESESGPEPEYHAVQTAEPGAAGVVAALPVATGTPAPIPPVDPEPALVSTPTALLDREREGDGEAASAAGPAHARSKKNREGKERRGVYTATIVLACLVLVIVAGALAVRSLHHATTPTTSSPAHSASRVSSPADAARIQTATDEVDSATTAARAGLASMTSFPTPSNVATIINPYISSLQLYEAVLSGSKVPPSATSEAASAETQVRQDLEFLGTIHGLPPVQLGAYLGQVGTDATQLRATLGDLEQDLRSPTS